MTVAAFMDLALYHPEFGYYARAVQRSGRAGDFFTSVDVGPLFGELLEVQIAEMAEILAKATTEHAERIENGKLSGTHTESRDGSGDHTEIRNDSVGPANSAVAFDLVEAGAGNGRLGADILRAARRRDPALYESINLHLVEASAAARAQHASTLGGVADRLVSSSRTLPDSFEGVLIANELLDAMPVHQVVMREDGLRETYIVASRQSPVTSDESPIARDPLTLVEGPLSTPAVASYLDRLRVRLEPGWRVEINLRAVDWIRDAARRLRRGFIVLIDYGHEARDLYSASHAAGTLTTYAGHRSGGPESRVPVWLDNPGDRDLTAHVDFTSVRDAAEAEGMTTLALLDQTYFVLGLMNGLPDPEAAIRSAQFKTLMMPGGLGSTHKVLILGKNVGSPTLQCASFGGRIT
jgi:SAM-dependent MidA family methyltransferase